MSLGGPGDALEKVDVGVRTFTDGDELRSQDVFARDADASFAAEFELIQPGADGTGERRVCDRLLVLVPRLFMYSQAKYCQSDKEEHGGDHELQQGGDKGSDGKADQYEEIIPKRVVALIEPGQFFFPGVAVESLHVCIPFFSRRESRDESLWSTTCETRFCAPHCIGIQILYQWGRGMRKPGRPQNSGLIMAVGHRRGAQQIWNL